MVAGDAAPFDGGMADAVPESEWLRASGERVAVLAPDRANLRQVTERLARALDRRFEARSIRRQRRDHDVHVAGPEGRLPPRGGALSGVSESVRARRHSLSKLPGEALEGVGRDAQRLQSLIGERHADPGVGRGARRVRGRRNHLWQTPDELPSGAPIVDAQYEIRRGVRSRTGPQDSALNVVQLQHDAIRPSRCFSRSARGSRRRRTMC